MDFQKAIYRSSRTKSDTDKRIFSVWENDEITTKRAIADFKKNHGIKEDITEDEFIEWMMTLGYFNRDVRYLIPTGCYRYE